MKSTKSRSYILRRKSKKQCQIMNDAAEVDGLDGRRSRRGHEGRIDETDANRAPRRMGWEGSKSRL